MSNKLIKDIDNKTWNIFVGFCRMRNVKVGKEIEKAINEYVRKRLKGVL